jgi:8-oxo-dGTP diphosphatase
MIMIDSGHSVSVSAIVFDERGHVLVIERRDNGLWEPPGGVLEIFETIPEGVSREVEEETGYSIRVERLTGVYKNMLLGVVALVFRGHRISGESTPNLEATSVSWLHLDDARTLMKPAYFVRVEDALVDDVAVRAHDGHVIL